MMNKDHKRKDLKKKRTTTYIHTMVHWSWGQFLSGRDCELYITL